MMVYHLILVIFLVLTFLLSFCLDKYKKNTKYLLLVFLLLTFFLVVRDETVGVDWLNYKKVFSYCHQYGFRVLFTFGGHELGFKYYNHLIGLIKYDYWFYLAVTAVISMIGVYKFVKKNSKDYFYSMLIFITFNFYGYYFGIIRQTLAISILLISVEYIKDRKLWKFAIAVFLATLIHKTAFAFFPLYFISYIKINKITFSIWLSAIALTAIFRDTILTFIFNYIYKPSETVTAGGGGYNMLIFLAFSAIIAYMWQDRLLKQNRHNQIFINMIFISTLLQVIATAFSLAYRVNLYFTFGLIILIPNILDTVNVKLTKRILFIFVLIFFAIFEYTFYLPSNKGNYANYVFNKDINYQILLYIGLGIIGFIVLVYLLREQKYVKKILKILDDPRELIFWLSTRRIFYSLSDSTFLKLKYRLVNGEKLHLKKPKTFNEKLQWLKIHDHNPKYTNLVDKYEVRAYLKEQIGEEYLIPLIGVYNNFDEIDFDCLPDRFVLKCTHDSGGVIVCKNKKNLDIQAAKNKINKLLKRNYFYGNREWPYKDIKPRIIIEEYMEDTKSGELIDYKIMCFNGEPQMLFTSTERYSRDGVKLTFFDLDFKKLPFERHYHASKKKINKPENFDKMLEFSRLLSKDIAFLRVDFYEVNGKLYIGELTFYPGSGFRTFTPSEWDRKLGDMITLPQFGRKLGDRRHIKK